MKRILYFLPVFFVSLLPAQLPTLNFVEVGTGFTAPVDIKNCGDDRLFIVERAGYIRIMSKEGVVKPVPFLDIDARVSSGGGEQGLLSLAFSPDYKNDGYFYVNYIAGTGSGSTRISRFKVNPVDSNLADPSSEKILLTFTQPYTNHNGATLMFGGDGYLYSTQGDGGSGGDPQNYAQNRNSLLGKILRLDVSNPDTTYTIPLSNPFVGVANTRPEIWSYGLRNPWRCSFDRLTKDIWIGDVGQNAYEEVNFQPSSSTGGENYGWRCYEGNVVYNTSGCSGPYVTPRYVYSHTYGGCSVTGGYVYRGAQYSKLWGRYLFTDYCSGKFWSLKQTGPNTFDPDTLQTFLTNNHSSFGEDNLGELYVTGISNGRIYRITESSDCNPVAFISFEDTIKKCKPVQLNALYGDSLSYQWYNSNGVMAGDTTTILEIQQSGWYYVKVTKPQAGCESFSDSIYVEVYDSTILTIIEPLIQVCAYDSLVPLEFSIEPAGGRFSGAGIVNDTFYVDTSRKGDNRIEYHYINSFGCPSDASFIVQVNDTTPLQLVSSPTPVCVNADTFNLNALVIPGGGLFSGEGVLTDNDFLPAAAGPGNILLNYKYVSAGCESNLPLAIKVFPIQTLTRNVSEQLYCVESADFSLDSFILPIGGEYSGTGVLNDTFSPAQAGMGEFLISYAFTDDSGCVSSDTFTLSVNICMGWNNKEDAGSWKIYPNPNNGSFRLLMSAEMENAELQVSDVTGKVVYRSKEVYPGGEIHLGNRSKGLYLVSQKTQSGVTFAKMLIE